MRHPTVMANREGGVMEGPIQEKESSKSSKPAIFGVTEAESEITVIASEEDLVALEQLGSEINTAISELVLAERELVTLANSGAEPNTMLTKTRERAEASSQLERRVSVRTKRRPGRIFSHVHNYYRLKFKYNGQSNLIVFVLK